MGAPRALTIGQTAERLGVTASRVHQLLREGRLAGPTVPTGSRAPAGIGRVYATSLESYERDRPAHRGPRSRETPSDLVPRQALVELKLALDAASEDVQAHLRLVEELQRTQDAAVAAHEALLTAYKAAVETSRALTAAASASQQVAQRQSAVLTNLLMPRDASELLQDHR